MLDLKDVVTRIMRGDFDEQLEDIYNAYRERSKIAPTEPERGDYIVYGQQSEYPYEAFERRASLTEAEAERLQATLRKREDLMDVSVELEEQGYHVIGYDETLKSVLKELPE